MRHHGQVKRSRAQAAVHAPRCVEMQRRLLESPEMVEDGPEIQPDAWVFRPRERDPLCSPERELSVGGSRLAWGGVPSRQRRRIQIAARSFAAVPRLRRAERHRRAPERSRAPAR
jgi:hypothetical protein